jgi:hypothetical protein
MAKDLRYFIGTDVMYDPLNENTTTVDMLATPTSGSEVLANKVVKYLLTYRGSDAIEPYYGGTALHQTNFDESYIPQLRTMLLSDIADCISYIKSTETEYTEYKLGDVDLVEFTYDSTSKDIQLHVHIAVYDTDGNKTPLFIKS